MKESFSIIYEKFYEQKFLSMKIFAHIISYLPNNKTVFLKRIIKIIIELILQL